MSEKRNDSKNLITLVNNLKMVAISIESNYNVLEGIQLSLIGPIIPPTREKEEMKDSIGLLDVLKETIINIEINVENNNKIINNLEHLLNK